MQQGHCAEQADCCLCPLYEQGTNLFPFCKEVKASVTCTSHAELGGQRRSVCSREFPHGPPCPPAAFQLRGWPGPGLWALGPVMEGGGPLGSPLKEVTLGRLVAGSVLPGPPPSASLLPSGLWLSPTFAPWHSTESLLGFWLLKSQSPVFTPWSP